MWLDVKVQTQRLCSLQEETEFALQASDAGALVVFQGQVRGNDGPAPLSSLWIECYPGVTDVEVHRIAALAARRWPLIACQVRHRIGCLLPQETIVSVRVAAKHRAAAFTAAEFLMDFLKQEAPFWKREHFIDGSSRWVAARGSDLLATQRWYPGSGFAADRG